MVIPDNDASGYKLLKQVKRKYLRLEHLYLMFQRILILQER